MPGPTVLQDAADLGTAHISKHNSITPAWAVDREFVNIDWAELDPNVIQLGSSLIQIGSNCYQIGSHWPHLGPEVEFGQFGVKIEKTWFSRR